MLIILLCNIMHVRATMHARECGPMLALDWFFFFLGGTGLVDFIKLVI